MVVGLHGCRGWLPPATSWPPDGDLLRPAAAADGPGPPPRGGADPLLPAPRRPRRGRVGVAALGAGRGHQRRGIQDQGHTDNMNNIWSMCLQMIHYSINFKNEEIYDDPLPIPAPGAGVLAAGAGAAVAGLPRGARPPPAGRPRQLRGRGCAAGGRARQVLTTGSCCPYLTFILML